MPKWLTSEGVGIECVQIRGVKLYITNSLQTAPETFGDGIWWNQSQIIHFLSYLLFLFNDFTNKKDGVFTTVIRRYCRINRIHLSREGFPQYSLCPYGGIHWISLMNSTRQGNGSSSLDFQGEIGRARNNSRTDKYVY